MRDVVAWERCEMNRSANEDPHIYSVYDNRCTRCGVELAPKHHDPWRSTVFDIHTLKYYRDRDWQDA
jgi:hypothetical protein